MLQIHRLRLTRLSAAAAAVGALAAGGVLALGPSSYAGTGPASATSPSSQKVPSYTFTALDNANDPTFNQLLGINDSGEIAGYFGSGATGHPNRGYTLVAPYGQANYTNEDFPGAQQTQVTGLNNRAITVGFYADTANDNFGFVDDNGRYSVVIDPNTPSMTAGINQLLGINDHHLAVGFYNDLNGISHGYEVNLHSYNFTPVSPPGTTGSTATGINDQGDVSGFTTSSTGTMVGFLLKGKNFTTLSFPGATQTQAFGVNNHDQVVGDYVGVDGVAHGFVYSNGTYTGIDDPNGLGTTTINGINNAGDIVGFYIDSAGNTDGFLGRP